VKAIGLPEAYVEGKSVSADSTDQSEEHLQTCAQAQRDAYIPDTHVRQRDARFATQDRHQPPTDETFLVADCTSDGRALCAYRTPGGRPRPARTHERYAMCRRRSDAQAAAAVRARMDWQDALALALTDPGFAAAQCMLDWDATYALGPQGQRSVVWME